MKINNKITQKEICRAVDLSPMTVYRYLYGKKVSLKTKNKIENYLRKNKYRPNLTARSLVLQKTNIIGLLVPTFSFWFYPDLIQNIQIKAREYGYKTLLCLSSEDPQQEKEELDVLLSIPVDGVIISPTNSLLSKENCKMLVEEKIPFVMVDRYFADIDASFIATDSYDGSRKIVQYLIDKGHKRIAHIGGPKSNSFSNNLLEGYIAVLKNNKLPIREEYIFSCPITLESGYNAAKEILKMKNRPTAIQALNDLVAHGAILAAKEENIRVPDDIAIAGYSNIKFVYPVGVPVITVTEPIDKLANEAVEALILLIEKRRKSKIVKFVTGELVELKGS